ncbi:MAG: DNA polymerase IV [Steroidobacteraceae bacterium]
MNAERCIAHLDMDAFYASVELLRYPQLRGLPVVIGGRRRRNDSADAAGAGEFERLVDYTGRGVVTTATYAAREFGVHSGLGLMKAAKLCPQALLLPADFDEYRRYSRLFKAAVTAIAPRMEDRGIDEVYVDFDAVPAELAATGAADRRLALARRIQDAVFAGTGLTCSIGVAPNKLLAKIASELHKPNGITIVHATDLAEKIWPLPCRRINGVGPKAAARLEELQVHTIGELAQCERSWLMEHFGRHHGAWLHEAAWGRDERDVVTHSEPVSMSCETTFERDLHAVRDRPELSALFTSLCERLAADLQRNGYAGRTIGIKLRYDNFRSVTRAVTLPTHTAEALVIRRNAGLCLRRAPLERRLRLLGVRVGGLVRAADLPQRELPPATCDLFQP